MTLEQIASKWPNEASELAKVTGEQRARFETWMAELEAEHERRGTPYGGNSIAEQTGPMCWFCFFEDGYTAAEALDEDLSCA